jgi:DNA ligase-1
MNRLEIAWTVLGQIACAKGSNAKKSILLGAIKTDKSVGEILSTFFTYSQDPFITFGVTVDDDLTRYQDVHLNELDAAEWWKLWIDLLQNLLCRKYSGDNAKERIYNLLSRGGRPIATWAIPMVNRDYQIGVGPALIDAIWPSLLTKFSCQLCAPWDGETVPKKAVVEPKFDGLRSLFFCDKLNPIVLSRNGKILHNVTHIMTVLLKQFPGMVVDGELFNKDWSSSVSAARSDEKGDVSSKLRAFDLLTIDEFKKQQCADPLWKRQKGLAALLGSDCVKFDRGQNVTTVTDVLSATQGYIQSGFEGGVLKDLDSLYTYDRADSWTKIKEFQTMDCKIIGLEEGKGRNADKLGAFIVEGQGLEPTNVGGGFSDVQRVAFWKKGMSMVGKTIEVKYQDMTSDKHLRFPVFIRLREDK